MSPRAFVVSARRRWYVVGVGAVLTLTALVLAHGTPGVYWSRMTLAILAPASVERSHNALASPNPVSMAALVVMDVNRAPLTLRAGSSDARLYGLGVREGTWVRLRSTGTQWVQTANQPFVDIEAVGPTPEAVQRRLDTAARAVRRSAVVVEDDLRVRPANRAILLQSPRLAPAVTWVPPSRSRALLGIVALGLALTGAAVHLVDRVLAPRLSRLPRPSTSRPRRPRAPRPRSAS